MGRTLRTKIMSGVIALLVLFTVALAVTLHMVYDSDNEVAGINEYHLPILSRLNSLDVITYEIELLAHRITGQGAPSAQRIQEVSNRSKECHEEIDAIFSETILLCEKGSQDAKNDLADRLEMARLVGEVQSLETEIHRFCMASTLPIELTAQSKMQEAQTAVLKLRDFEYLDPIISKLRQKANRLALNSLAETRANISSIIWTNAFIFLVASILGFFVFLLITGRLQKAFRRLNSAFHETADGKYSDPLPVTSTDEIGELTTSFNTMVDQLKSKEKLREAFGQFLDPRIVANVVNPATGVMAFWTTPFSEGEDHARDACFACLEMRPAFAKIEQEISQITGLRRNIPKFHVRMALATGDTLIGTIGSATTKSFTVIGDTVNIASRLEGVNKVYGTDLIINEDCYRLAELEIEAREIDFVTVYGKTEPVRIYELLSKMGQLDPKTAELRDAFAIALQLYREQKWPEAEKAFQNCLKISKNDGPSIEFLTRIATFARTPPPKDWNGVWQTASK